MSYRELRSFTEKMRVIGYPGLLSMDSFKSPNFPLVADVLLWLVRSYDANAEIPDDVSSEQDRIMFIKAVAQLMATKAHIRLNTRKLYMSDGNAVRELLKIATVIHQAVLSCSNDDEEEDSLVYAPPDITSKLAQLKACRSLASEITEKGAILFDLLGKELELRDARSAVVSRNIDMKTLESAVLESVTAMRAELETTQKAIDNLGADETNLQAKIDRKRQELDRAEKRLKSLEGVRPAYMDEYEKIEMELARLYEGYVTKFCNLAYLERQLEELERIEADKFQETETNLKLMQMRLQEEEVRLLRGDGEILDDDYEVGSSSAGTGGGGNAGVGNKASPNLSHNGSYASPQISAASRAHRPKGAAPTRSARSIAVAGAPSSHGFDEYGLDEDELDINSSDEDDQDDYADNRLTTGTARPGAKQVPPSMGLLDDDGSDEDGLDDEDDLSDHDF
ncbi:hypothetical protein SmJEL517_g01837 [Synchytrium microbalum]|uniref:Clusterin-associated protein 1 n=1 Tax=Synchytrium microbalum TaxID=1806994 RepID=A0A507C4S5_9FUNG|nr:uncharacterized protein SmJEL517_g01837 [Synchytrium microbalum]TPX35987.1 hypothetical protein SmJEL517_g01837 [Synchytrium microbalum]